MLLSTLVILACAATCSWGAPLNSKRNPISVHEATSLIAKGWWRDEAVDILYALGMAGNREAQDTLTTAFKTHPPTLRSTDPMGFSGHRAIELYDQWTDFGASKAFWGEKTASLKKLVKGGFGSLRKKISLSSDNTRRGNLHETEESLRDLD